MNSCRGCAISPIDQNGCALASSNRDSCHIFIPFWFFFMSNLSKNYLLRRFQRIWNMLTSCWTLFPSAVLIYVYYTNRLAFSVFDYMQKYFCYVYEISCFYFCITQFVSIHWKISCFLISYLLISYLTFVKLIKRNIDYLHIKTLNI